MSDSKQSGGIGCFTVVLIVLITLKLFGLIIWPWWFVLCPIWVPIILLVFIGMLYGCLK
jgi:hypothetical protein